MPSLYHFLILRRSRQLGFRQLHSPSLDITSPTFTIYGSNTGVGKTLVSAGLAISVLSNPKPSPNPSFLYVKPVQTGFPADSDARFVLRKATALFDRSPSSSSTLLASNHMINASTEAKDGVLGFYEEARVGRKEDGGEEAMLACRTLFGWREAVSAHLAAEREGMRVDDDSLREALGKCLLGFGEGKNKKEGVWKVIETAGGVASPGPSGTLQCDLYRPFRFPVILVGDGHLGGISATVSAYESLKIRGYDVTAIILVDHGLSNEVPLKSYLRNSVDVLVLPPIPEDPSNNLIDWFCESSEVFSSLQEKMLSAHVKRLQRLHDMPQKAANIIWWPFTQHQLVPEQAVTVIDSRCGENFAVHKDCKNQDMIIPQFDACASWWTQGPDATLQMELARDMGYSAGRYGHVMFPENVHEPALRCAELLLEGVGKGWATRAYFSDNGSTAVEIALKMAFRKFSFDHGIHLDHKVIMSHGHITIKVLALNGSYHGDTLGAMEAQAPSSFTSSLQQPWYSGRGLFLDPPTIFMSNEIWTLSIPDTLNAGHLKSGDMWFNSRDELFSQSRDSSAVAGSYAAYISNQLVQFSELSHSTHIAALIIEPVVQGAGGMHMIDPLFQRILVRECQIRKIPVIFDEVFAGFWRLGRESAAELLDCLPDIACFGKLMTGGVIPLAVTLTKEAIFEVFKGDSKLMALLHGHSYSAHAVGCTAAAKAIKWFKDPQANMNFEPEGKKLKELWDIKLVSKLSSHPAVQRVVSLGTLCAIELRTDASESGYASLFASSLVQRLRDDGVYLRPLGNVIYLMCGPCTSAHFCSQQLNKVHRRINELDKGRGRESHSHHSYASQES